MKIPLLILLATTPLFAGELDFWRENIAARVVAADTITIDGTYFFRSSTGAAVHTQLFYPFPLDSVHDYPVRWAARSAAGGAPIVCRESREGFFFPVSVEPGAVCSLLITYTQHVRKSQARYILSTTKAWDKPLGPSNYTVTLPSKMTLLFLSYEADTVISSKGQTTHRFFRDNFMPDRDLAFEWAPPKARALPAGARD
jgi:hypothetical protein